jgi:hypothetical protein
MFLGRFGSLNSLEKTRRDRVWRKILDGGELPSADTLGRVAEQIDSNSLREVLVDFYRELRRKKALPKLSDGLIALAFDGHESTASYLQSCSGCGTRMVGKDGDRRTQYYHRFVFCSLVGKDYHLFLDVEPIRPGEGEVVAARRLYHRVHPLYSRAYDIVVGDAIYLEGPFFQDAIDRKKDVLAVLKREDLNLFEDAEALFDEREPEVLKRRGRENRCWDLEGFTSFPTVEAPLRVVKALETSRVKRHLTGEMEENVARWMWATTISAQRATTKDVIDLGRSRWDIENRGFNEGASHYKIDHVYRHDLHAMLVILLLAMLAMNLFEVFYRRNLKPQVRDRYSKLDVARMVKAALYVDLVRVQDIDLAPG